MPSFVSKDHKALIQRLRKMYPEYEVLGWPDAEINIGRLVGLADANLRADVFIRFSEREAVVVEWQSSIHALEESSEWFNKDDIAGRDDLKRQMCAKCGVGLLELWTLDMSDATLSNMIRKKRVASHLSDTAVKSLDENRATFGDNVSGFKTDEKSFGDTDGTFSDKSNTFGSDSGTFNSHPFDTKGSSFGTGAGFKTGGFGK